MRTAIAALILICPAVAQALPDASPARRLASRVAGAPRTCISSFEADRGSQSFKSGDILFSGRGSTLYLNHPADCPALGPDRAIISRTPTASLCRGDIIQVVDLISKMGFGGCSLGEFTPYDRPRSPKK